MGVTYTHWASDSCPTGSLLVYSGYILVSAASTNPQFSEPLCQTMEVNNTSPVSVQKAVSTSLSNITCSVCLVPTQSAIFVHHGSSFCPMGWSLIYSGWMAVLPSTNVTTPFCASGNQFTGERLQAMFSIKFLIDDTGNRQSIACSLCSM